MFERFQPDRLADRTYAFLVDRILPTHLLSRSRRTGLEQALAAGEPDALYTAAVAALQDLEDDGVFAELPAPHPGARAFRRLGRGDRILLETPRRREQQASRPAEASGPSAIVDQPRAEPQARLAPGAVDPGPAAAAWPASGTRRGAPQHDQAERATAPPPEAWTAPPPEPAAPGPEAAPAGAAVAVDPALEPGTAATATPAPAAPEPQAGAEWPPLEPFLELATVEPHLEPFGDRLRRIVAQLEASLPGAHSRLLCLDSENAEALGDGAVQMLDRAAADEIPHYREALRLGETQFATSAPVGADPASGRIAAAVPLYVSGLPWGLLRVTWEAGSVRSVPELARLLAPLARLVAVAIQNQAMLEKLVFVDPLTGVYNRAFYDRQVALEIERANRTNSKLGLLVMDIDDFKPINDQYGHRAGDQVLSQIGREVRARMRKIDLLFRYGGEEFVLLLPGADLEEAQRTAERLRQVVAEQRFLPEGVAAPLRVTVSIGGAVYPDQSRTRTGLFNAADTALYRAKNEGKNRVAF
jgi:diguanylate cyclase (GGDEF)-like protein